MKTQISTYKCPRIAALCLCAGAAAMLFAGCDPSGPDQSASQSAENQQASAVKNTDPAAQPSQRAPGSSSGISAGSFQKLDAPGLTGEVRLSPAVMTLSEKMRGMLKVEDTKIEAGAHASNELRTRRVGDILLYDAEESAAGQNTANQHAVGEQIDEQIDEQGADTSKNQHPWGFWRYIERVENRGESVVYHTRQARLNEVIQDGTIDITVLPSSTDGIDELTQQLPGDDALARRQQELGLGDLIDTPVDFTYTKSFDAHLPLDSTTEFQVLKNNVKIDTGGDLDFRPGFKFKIEVGDFTVQKLEFTALGRLDLDADLTLTVNEGQGSPSAVDPQVVYHEIPLCSSDPGGAITCEDGNPTFGVSLLGQRLEIYPHLTSGFAWSGAAAGKVKTGVRASGNIKAGYAFNKQGENEKIFDNQISGNAKEPEYEGSVDMNLKMSLELGMTASLSGEPLIVAYPFEGVFSANASTLAPVCGVKSSLKVSGRVVRHGFMGAGSWPLYQNVPFDINYPIDAPGCTTDNTENAEACSVANPNCPAGHTCNLGYCVENTPLQISLTWSDPDSDLDLIVQNPDGEILLPSGSGDAQPANHGWMAVTSCAGVCDGGATLDNKFTEVALFRLAQQGALYRFWVRNNTPQPAAGAADVNYRVQVIADGMAVNTMEGTLPAESGAESFRYVFNNTHAF